MTFYVLRFLCKGFSRGHCQTLLVLGGGLCSPSDQCERVYYLNMVSNASAMKRGSVRHRVSILPLTRHGANFRHSDFPHAKYGISSGAIMYGSLVSIPDLRGFSLKDSTAAGPRARPYIINDLKRVHNLSMEPYQSDFQKITSKHYMYLHILVEHHYMSVTHFFNIKNAFLQLLPPPHLVPD